MVAGTFVLALLACGPPESADARSRVVGHGAWSYFGDPRAISYAGGVAVGWATPGGGVQAGLVTPRGVRRTWLMRRLGHPDDHNNPSFVKRRDGRLMAFWSPHSGRQFPRRDDGPSAMYYRTTVARGSFRFGTLKRLPRNTPGRLGFTYPNPVLVNGRVWLFWRGGRWFPSYAVQRSNGRWSPPRELVRGPRGHRPYAKYASDGKRVVAAFTGCHVNACARNSLWVAEYRNRRWRRLDGSSLATTAELPFRASEATLVFDGRNERGAAWIMDVALAPDGSIVVLYEARTRAQVNARYFYAVWRDGSWRRRRIRGLSGLTSPGGATLDHEDPRFIYRSVGNRGVRQIEALFSPDDGDHWHHRIITRNPAESSIRPVSPRGSLKHELLWLSGRRWTYRRFATRVRYRSFSRRRFVRSFGAPLRSPSLQDLG